MSEHTATESHPERARAGLPVRLIIPAIGVDAAIVSVGMTSDGLMGAPKKPAEVGWFHLGPRPGDIGSAVIDGHYDWIGNKEAVFTDLHMLQEGDEISVADEDGGVSIFVVRSIQKYDKDQDAANIFTSSDDKAHLNLITCAGAWDKAKASYADRLVIFSDEKESE